MAPTRITPEAVGLVALGGAVGAGLREVAVLAWPAYPLTVVLAVNVVGCLALGLVVAWVGGRRRALLLLGTGLCGGFTTYSAVAVQVVERVDAGSTGVAAGYALATLVLGAVATVAGLVVGGAAGARTGGAGRAPGSSDSGPSPDVGSR